MQRFARGVDQVLNPVLMMKRMLLSAVVFAAGCQYDPFAHEFTSNRPADGSVAGRYVPEDDTARRLRTRFKIEVSSESEVLLNTDGTFLAMNLPHCWYNTFDCVPGSEAWQGTWALKQHQDWWAVALHITSRNGNQTSYGIPMMIRGDASPYLLHLTIGDPDSGGALAFRRKSPP